MLKKLKESLFYIGVIIISLTLFAEHLFSIETALTSFLMGFGCGLQLVGVVVLMVKRWKQQA